MILNLLVLDRFSSWIGIWGDRLLNGMKINLDRLSGSIPDLPAQSKALWRCHREVKGSSLFISFCYKKRETYRYVYREPYKRNMLRHFKAAEWRTLKRIKV